MRGARPLLALATAACLVASCTGLGSSPDVATLMPSATPVAVTPAPATPAPTADATPPEASLAVEGGDPVPGQLGSYVWGGSGIDSPWLPGAPVAVGAGETLVVALAPLADVATWTARAVPAGDPGAVDPTPLGEGTGAPAFAPPPTGHWSVAVTIHFAADVGDATYYWAVDVR